MDRFRAGADTLNISLAARPKRLGINAATIRLRTKLGALQKHRPSANESVRASNAAGEARVRAPRPHQPGRSSVGDG